MSIYNHLVATTIISQQQTEAIEKWIENHKFKDYESPEWKLNHEMGWPRNKLYQFILNDINC